MPKQVSKCSFLLKLLLATTIMISTSIASAQQTTNASFKARNDAEDALYRISEGQLHELSKAEPNLEYLEDLQVQYASALIEFKKQGRKDEGKILRERAAQIKVAQENIAGPKNMPVERGDNGYNSANCRSDRITPKLGSSDTALCMQTINSEIKKIDGRANFDSPLGISKINLNHRDLFKCRASEPFVALPVDNAHPFRTPLERLSLMWGGVSNVTRLSRGENRIDVYYQAGNLAGYSVTNNYDSQSNSADMVTLFFDQNCNVDKLEVIRRRSGTGGILSVSADGCRLLPSLAADAASLDPNDKYDYNFRCNEQGGKVNDACYCGSSEAPINPYTDSCYNPQKPRSISVRDRLERALGATSSSIKPFTKEKYDHLLEVCRARADVLSPPKANSPKPTPTKGRSAPAAK
jgi:hypothetical protein